MNLQTAGPVNRFGSPIEKVTSKKNSKHSVTKSAKLSLSQAKTPNQAQGNKQG